MAKTVADLMTAEPITMPDSASLVDAAAAMREADIGDVIVMRGGDVCGILTDRDIVVRAVADGRDPRSVRLGDVASEDLVALSPQDPVDKAVELMRSKALRRLPVVEGGEPVGIVSLGDLAIEQDRGSALADISAAPPNT